MEHRFRDAMISADLSNRNTTLASLISRMFANTTQFNSDISDLDTSYITGGAYMIWERTQFNRGLSRWEDTNLGMKQMFMDAYAFNQDLCAWGTQVDSSNDVTDSKRVQISLTLTR
jgi:hypothetical protein